MMVTFPRLGSNTVISMQIHGHLGDRATHFWWSDGSSKVSHGLHPIDDRGNFPDINVFDVEAEGFDISSPGV
ncbi:hypothetical protein MY5147_009133 [Beauveria neobassiana]